MTCKCSKWLYVLSVVNYYMIGKYFYYKLVTQNCIFIIIIIIYIFYFGTKQQLDFFHIS